MSKTSLFSGKHVLLMFVLFIAIFVVLVLIAYKNSSSYGIRQPMWKSQMQQTFIDNYFENAYFLPVYTALNECTPFDSHKPIPILMTTNWYSETGVMNIGTVIANPDIKAWENYILEVRREVENLPAGLDTSSWVCAYSINSGTEEKFYVYRYGLFSDPVGKNVFLDCLKDSMVYIQTNYVSMAISYDNVVSLGLLMKEFVPVAVSTKDENREIKDDISARDAR